MSQLLSGQMEFLSRLRGISTLTAEERDDALRSTAEELGQSYAQLHGTASFYADFNGLGAEKRMDPVIRVQGMLLGSMDLDSILAQTMEDPGKMLEEIAASGLTGRGGAGFPVSRKWESVRAEKETDKYVFCNCSEGELYTCKDLALLLNVPETVAAGVLVCCFITGAKRAEFYLRAGYEDAARRLENVIERIKIRFPEIQMKVVINGGAYVCGEETGLISSAEGKRGEPRLKPPFPGQSGYLGKPTVINNAETFACIPHILRLGAEEYRKQETKLFSVSGCGCEEGIYELPVNTTVNGIRSLCGCRDRVKTVQLGGGASGMLLDQTQFDVPLSSGSCREAGLSLGTGSIRFIGEKESIPELCLETAGFFMNESCGKCTPCRNGLRQLYSTLEKAVNGEAEEDLTEKLKELALYIRDNSRCALGAAAPGPLLSALEHFENEFTALAAERDSL